MFGLEADTGLVPALEIEGVERRFGATVALAGVSFSVPRHSIFGLLGPNGAGKTTLFSIIAGFLRADAGRWRMLGEDGRRLHRLFGRVSILPQDAQFQRNVPILDQLVYFRRLNGRSRLEARREVGEALERVGLGEYAMRGVQVLSHGMLKRLGVAQAFLGEPELILLDEPTSGLDPRNARQIRDLVRSLRSRATILISSHNLLEIEEICDHVAILDRGRLVAAGSVAEVTHAGRYLRLELGRTPIWSELESMRQVTGVTEIVALPPAGLAVTIAPDVDPDATILALLEILVKLKLPPRALTRGSSLEDQFLSLTDRQ